MLGMALQIVGSNARSIQAAPIASEKASPDTSKRIKHDLQKAGKRDETETRSAIPAAQCSSRPGLIPAIASASSGMAIKQKQVSKRQRHPQPFQP